MELLTERHMDRLAGVLSCYDRMITGTLPGARGVWPVLSLESDADGIFHRLGISLRDHPHPLYEPLSREAVLSVKAEQVSTFLGKKFTAQVAAEIGSRLSIRIEGICIKHRLGSCSVKLYDKFGRVLRIETTTNDVSFFKHHRKVEHRDRHVTRELAPLKNSIYRLIDLREILLGCNRRYLAFLSALDDHSAGARVLDRLTEPKHEGEHHFKGLNFFAPVEQTLLRALPRPQFNIHGLCRADLMPHLPGPSPSSLTRRIRRLRVLGLLKRVAGTYRYYLTRLGRQAIAASCALTEFILVPALANAKV